MCDNLQDCCRLCLDVNSDHVSILGDPATSMHIKACLSLNVSPNDCLPKAICVSCVSQLNKFYNFQLNARYSQDWLESSMQEVLKKTTESKNTIQPLPDSEYNSDSLLEFLNNTANIEEYLNNLGKEDIPTIVNMLDRNEQCIESGKATNLKTKNASPKKKDKNYEMEIDVLDSDLEIVKKVIRKETDMKPKTKSDKNVLTCFGCKMKFDNIQKLSQHISLCDNASRTCIHCHTLFDSKQKAVQHSLTHNTSLPITCNCGEQFSTKERWIQHNKTCPTDHLTSLGCIYRCKECMDTFKDRFDLYKHAKMHLLKAKQRICDICGHIFKGNEALAQHKKENHEKTDNLLYRCKVCNLTSSDRKDMYLHVKKHTEKPEQVCHLCESCGRSFATRASLVRHSQQHDHNKYRCRICNVRFDSEKELDMHILEHIQMVMCEKCGQIIIDCKLADHRCV